MWRPTRYRVTNHDQYCQVRKGEQGISRFITEHIAPFTTSAGASSCAILSRTASSGRKPLAPGRPLYLLWTLSVTGTELQVASVCVATTCRNESTTTRHLHVAVLCEDRITAPLAIMPNSDATVCLRLRLWLHPLLKPAPVCEDGGKGREKIIPQMLNSFPVNHIDICSQKGSINPLRCACVAMAAKPAGKAAVPDQHKNRFQLSGFCGC